MTSEGRRLADASMPAPRTSWSAWVVLVLMTATFAAVFAALAVLRHDAYQSHAFDLGNMDQAVWNTLHGRPLRFTDMQSGENVLLSRLAIHVEPLLVLFAALYAVFPDPRSLLVAQACIVAIGAVPAYLLARDQIHRPYLALVFPAAYLMHPSLQNAVLDDFHAVALSACFLMWALLCATRDQRVGFAAFALLAACTKEEVSLVVAAMSLLFARRHRLTAAAGFALGLVWFAVCVAIIIPHFNPVGHSPYLGRYRYLGRGIGGIALGAARHPDVVIRVLTSQSRLGYLQTLAHPLGWTSLLGLPVLAVCLPTLAINMLSSDPTMYSGLYQYSAEVVPVLVGSAAVGVGHWSRLGDAAGARFRPLLAPALCILILVSSLIDTRRFGFSPLADGYSVPQPGMHQALEDRLLTSVPHGAVVAAADEIEPHLSHRGWIYLLPTVHPRNGPPAAYVALDASIPSLPTTPRTLAGVVRTLLRQDYGVYRAQDGVLILKRAAPMKVLPGRFFGFAFQRPAHLSRLPVRWGTVRLDGVVLHPRSLAVNRSRPAISVEAFIRRLRSSRVTPHVRLYFSPVYQGGHPPYSRLWRAVDDTPTVDWLPSRLWPNDRSIRLAFLPYVPDTNQYGKVDVALSIAGAGPLSGSSPRDTIKGQPQAVRLATVEVGY